MSARNPFIQVKVNRLWELSKNIGTPLRKLHQQANFYKKEYDLDTTLQIHSFLKWKQPTKDVFYISPLLFKPVRIIHNRKIESEYRVEVEDDTPYSVNPILVHSFSRFFDINFPETVQEIDNFTKELISSLSTANETIEITTDFDETQSWQLIHNEAVGNFNYKKSLLGKDFNHIIDSPNQQVQQILDGSETGPIESDQITTLIQPLDFSQKKAVELSESSNLVIQGPPGTGKSHTIVGLIGNYLSKGKKVLFVSQKRSALEVVQTRLGHLGLAHLTAFLNTEKDEKKAFYTDLRSAWDILSSPIESKENPQIQIDQPLTNFYLKKFGEANENLAGSIHDTVKYLAGSGYSKKELEVISKVPSLKDWKKNESLLMELEKSSSTKFNVNCIGKASFTLLNKAVFTEKDPIITLDKRINELELTLTDLDTVETQHGIQGTIKELTQICLAASILNMVNKTQLNLLNQDSAVFKSFGSAAKKYQLLKTKVDKAEQASSNWKHKPTKTEITELLDLIKHQHAPKGIFGVLKRKNERLANAFQDFDPKLSAIAKQQLLEELRSEWNLQTELAEIQVKLKHDFNIENPENDIAHILQLRNKLSSISQNAYVQILEHENSIDLIKELTKLHPKIQHFNHLAKFIFNDSIPESSGEIIQLIKQLKADLHEFKLMSSDLKKYFNISQATRNFIIQNKSEVKKLTAIVAYQNLIEQCRFEKAFDKLEGKALEDELNYIENREAESFENALKSLQLKQQRLVQTVEELLRTPASKLKEDRKIEKKKFRAIKKTMVHEMAKKQRHMPIKQFTAETWDYLSDIHPLWIMNPLSVSERLDCIENMFDVVIFDESSQIPLEDAIPAIQRAKQVIVVGDDKQMPPGSFFSNYTEGLTLLDKADVSYPNIMLKWHYRSEHPALIEFSNKHFYENELLTIPPASIKRAIELIKLDGLFENSVNSVEAKAIAKYISENKNLQPDQIGIIAFSKEQENEIRKELQRLKLLSENLMIRNLENVQGAERDVIIISIGYAKNPEGVFRMNFGPINQQSGSNRLNVLFTRAKQKIVLFSSIVSDDFKITDNIGVTCLRDYIAYAESVSTHNTKAVIDNSENNELDLNKLEVIHYTPAVGSAIQCIVEHNSGKALLIDPCLNTNEADDLQTIYSLLKVRFKRVKILLSLDEWNNKEQYENEIKKYFA